MWGIALLGWPATASLTIDDFEVGPVACVDVGPLGLGLDDTDCESAPLSQSHVAGGVRLVSLEAAGGSYMTGTLVPVEGADDGLLLSGVGDHVDFPSGTAYLTYDGTEGDAAPSFSAGALDLDLSLFDSLVLEAPEDTSAFISVRLLLSDSLQTRSSGWASATAGSYFFPLSEFTAVDLAHIRQIQFVISPRTGESLHVLDISAVADPSPGSGLFAPTTRTPANGGTASTQNTAFSWSPVQGATGYRLAVATDPNALPDNPAASACAGCSFVRTTMVPAYVHDVALPASTVHWWRVQALPAGRWSDPAVFTTLGSSALQITSPAAGSTIEANSVIVKGLVTPPPSFELAVEVNGVVSIHGPANFAATVPIASPRTILTATARDGTGTVVARQAIPITVNTPAEDPVISLSVAPDMGTVPFTAHFAFNSDLAPTLITLDADGNGTPDYAGQDFEDVSFTYAAPGIYEPTVTALTGDGTTYSASKLVRVFTSAELDLLLKPKWTALKNALRSDSITNALQQVLTRRRAQYTSVLQSLTIPLSGIDSELTELIIFDAQLGRNVTYQMLRVENGTTYSYPVVFTLDDDGIWRLGAF